MKSTTRALKLHQVDQMLSSWREAALTTVPPAGWIRTIREALGMPRRALAARLGITPPGLHKLETTEAEQQITLATLRRLAEALDCDLRYALVPRQTLLQQLHARAAHVARTKLAPVVRSMSLEDQRVTGKGEDAQLAMLAKELLDGPRNKLW